MPAKAQQGDRIRFVVDARGMALLWPHAQAEHLGEVISVEYQPQRHRPSPRSVYIIHCECGKELKARSNYFEVVSDG